MKYTLVQHSAAGYKRDPGFARGLESRTVSTPAQLERVERAGGMLFDDYSAAEDKAMELMYPTDYPGITPAAPGTFSTLQVDGLRIYVPSSNMGRPVSQEPAPGHPQAPDAE